MSGPIVVGLAGGTASGKSTLSEALAGALAPDCVVVAHDRWYRSATPGAPLPNFDHPDSLEHTGLVHAVAELRAGRPVRAPRYDFTTHQRTPPRLWDLLQPQRTIVVEGILLLAVPEVRSCLDVAVYVDAPADVRLARRMRRDLVERGRSAESVLDQYEATVRPMHEAFVEPSRHHATLVVDGTQPVHQLVPRVISLLRPRPSGP